MELSTVIKWIVAVCLLAGIVYLLFFGPGKLILKYFSKLPAQAQESGSSNFDTIKSNIEACKKFTDINCVCDVMPSWPGTFVKNSRLVILESNKKTQLNWTYNDKAYRNVTIDDLAINAMIFPDRTVVAYEPRKEIDWASEPPMLWQQNLGSKGFLGIGKKEYKVVSGHLYKASLSNTLFLLISDKPSNQLSQLEPELKALKKCEK